MDLKQSIIEFVVYKSKRKVLQLQSYEPTEDQPEDEKEQLYEELKEIHPIILGDMNTNKVGREQAFRPTIRKYNLHEDSNDN